MRSVLQQERFSRLAILCISASVVNVVGAFLLAAEPAPGTLYVGAATVDITPAKPAPLMGQMNLRVSKSVESPVTAAALALECRQGDKVVDQAIFVTCDLAVLRGDVPLKVRALLKDRVAGFDLRKVLFNATHTHSAPAMVDPGYAVPKEGVTQPAEYHEFLVGRLAEVIEKAWAGRKPGRAGWGLGHAVVAQHRRAVYADGHAQMYGKTNDPNFRGMEGYEDHGVEVLCFWGPDDKLIATAINVACPAQEVEHNLAISADYWHEVRKLLRARHGDELVVLGWIGAAGDQSPHLMYRKDAEERMRRLRGLTRLEELARRIDVAWEDAYQGAVKEKHAEVVLGHITKTIELPMRVVTAEECAKAKAELEKIAKSGKSTALTRWHQRIIDRYAEQQAGPLAPHKMELHVVRLGDVAITSNDFELYTDFGVQMKARSPAMQTFVIQLAGEGSYLPTERAVRGGGYGAVPQSNRVGPEGGQVLVEQTLEAIGRLWAK